MLLFTLSIMIFLLYSISEKHIIDVVNDDMIESEIESEQDVRNAKH